MWDILEVLAAIWAFWQYRDEDHNAMDQDDYAMDKATTRMTSFQHEKRAPGQDYNITDEYYNARDKLLERGLQF